MSIKQLKQDFDNISLMKIFEIEVTHKIQRYNNEIGDTEFLFFNISIDGNGLKAQHVALSEKQDRSKKIAFVKIPLDDCFSIDENLEALYEECLNAIIEGTYFNLI